jgi:hypothetical protein
MLLFARNESKIRYPKYGLGTPLNWSAGPPVISRLEGRATSHLPDPDIIAADIIEDLQAALEQFAAIQTDLAGR